MDYLRYSCFPETYVEGRGWFRAAAAAAGARLASHVLPARLGPDGEELATDVAWLGPPDARHVFLSIAGTHGTEYFCGVAGQLQWLATADSHSLPPGVAVCLVHAHNPYGAAYASRSNENNVDLNRNFFPGPLPPRTPALGAALRECLYTREMSEHVLVDAMARFQDLLAGGSRPAVLEAIGAGQNSHPDGLTYCGVAPEWSTRNLQQLVSRDLARAEKVAVLDWHTGLGAFGAASLMTDMAPDTEAFRWAATWWGVSIREDADEAPFDPGENAGLINSGVARMLRERGAIVANAVVEIGTYENPGVLASLLVDRWLRFECRDRNDPHAVRMRTLMAERLNPSVPEWRRSALAHAARLYRRSITGLASWR